MCRSCVGWDVGAAGVPELHVGDAAFGVDGAGDGFPAGDLGLEEEAWDAGHGVTLGSGVSALFIRHFVVVCSQRKTAL